MMSDRLSFLAKPEQWIKPDCCFGRSMFRQWRDCGAVVLCRWVSSLHRSTSSHWEGTCMFGCNLPPTLLQNDWDLLHATAVMNVGINIQKCVSTKSRPSSWKFSQHSDKGTKVWHFSHKSYALPLSMSECICVHNLRWAGLGRHLNGAHHCTYCVCTGLCVHVCTLSGTWYKSKNK